MNWEAIGQWIGKHFVQVCFVISLVVQFTPIKINPWSALFKWIGKLITENSNKNIQTLITKTNELENSIDSVRASFQNETASIGYIINENEKDRIRWEILDFANSCRNKRKHTKDEFQHIITLNDKYMNLLKKTDDKNGVFEEEYHYILNLYHKLQETNGFLISDGHEQGD